MKTQGETLEEILEPLVVTAEVCGTDLSRGAAMVMASELVIHALDDVLTALSRCRRELTGRLSLAAILERLPRHPTDHPGAEEAWGMVPKSQEESAVVTSEMLTAMGAAMPLWDQGDRVAARMTFREVYSNLVANATELPCWRATLGTDVLGREPVLVEAVRLGRLPQAYVDQIRAGSPQLVMGRMAIGPAQ